jgi:energy-coupling factor transport system substrate-specific component
MHKYSWKLKDIIMMGMLCVVFGAVYLAAVSLASFLAAALTPFGLAQLGYEIVFGVWFMAATLAGYILRKPGAALIAEVLAALIEVLMGNMFGPMVIVAGVIQGAGAEAVFAITRYRKFDMKTMCLAAAGCCVTSFLWSFVRSGYILLSPGLLVIFFLVRLVSSVLLTGVLCKLLGDGLAKAGLLKSYL